MSSNKIEFIPFTKEAEVFIPPPVPAINSIPDWYKSTPLTINGKKPGFSSGADNIDINTTIKGCSPFLDAFSYGYMWTLPVDIEITKLNNESVFKWRVDIDLISAHDPKQVGNMPSFVEETDGNIYKWLMPFGIKTPKGYSTLFTHPLNRNELPFRVMSGIVDTDTYHVPVNFPFKLIEFNEEKIFIEKGTPLCQIIPFKRDDWQSSMHKYDESFTMSNFFKVNSKIVRAYKNIFWVKKTCR